MTMDEAIFHIGSCRLDPAKRELWNGTAPVTLTPHVFDCLTYLVSNRDRAIGRDELIAAVWGRVDINDTLLSQTIMHARRAVGDDGTRQQMIRTIPRFGYRWVDEDIVVAPAGATPPATAPVAPDVPPAAQPRDDAPEPSGPSGPSDADAQPLRRRPGRLWLVAALGAPILLALLAAVSFLPPRAPEPTIADAAAVTPKADLVLVLPALEEPGSEIAWVPLGLMDSIAGRLRDGSWPVVPSATSVALAHRTDPPTDIPEMTAATGAGLVVHPQVSHETGKWRVTLELSGRADLPARVDAVAAELLDASWLASDRLLALLKQQPLPEMARADPDFAVAQLVQRVEAEFLAGHLDAAGALLAEAPESLRQHGEVRWQAAQWDYRSGRLDEAQQEFSALLAQVPDESRPELRARALIALGSIARTRADFSAAEQLYRQAIDALAHLDQPALSGMAQAYLGITLGSMRRFDQAMTQLGQARILLESTGDALGIATVDAGFATLLADRRRLADAAPRLAQAIAGFERLGATAEATGLRIALAQMHLELLDNGAALEQSRLAWERIGNRPSHRLYPMAAAVRVLALTGAGRLHEAGQVNDLTQTHARSQDHAYQWRQMRLAAARLHVAMERWSLAEQELAAIFAASSAPDEAGAARLLWLRVLRAQGRAITEPLAGMAQWTMHSDAETRLYAQLISAEAHWADADPAQAYSFQDAALSTAEQLGVPALIALVAESYGDMLIADGRLEQAASVVGRIAPWAQKDYDCALLEVHFYRALSHTQSWQRALQRAQALAGERKVPAHLMGMPEALAL